MFLSRLFRRKKAPVIQEPLNVDHIQPAPVVEEEMRDEYDFRDGERGKYADYIPPITPKAVKRETVVFRRSLDKKK